jgi:hypothetical protein
MICEDGHDWGINKDLEGGGCDLISRYHPDILLDSLTKIRKNLWITVAWLQLKLGIFKIEV